MTRKQKWRSFPRWPADRWAVLLLPRKMVWGWAESQHVGASAAFSKNSLVVSCLHVWRGSWLPNHSDLDSRQELGATVFPQVSHWRCWGSRHHYHPPTIHSCLWEAMEAASSVPEAKGASVKKHCPEGSHLVPSPVPQIPAGGLRS